MSHRETRLWTHLNVERAAVRVRLHAAQMHSRLAHSLRMRGPAGSKTYQMHQDESGRIIGGSAGAPRPRAVSAAPSGASSDASTLCRMVSAASSTCRPRCRSCSRCSSSAIIRWCSANARSSSFCFCERVVELMLLANGTSTPGPAVVLSLRVSANPGAGGDPTPTTKSVRTKRNLSYLGTTTLF